jgi:APA family basic amino acid/polyamine antiporter
MPWIPIGAAGVCLLLMLDLPLITWIRFVVWLGIGLTIYATYSVRHSRLNAWS